MCYRQALFPGGHAFFDAFVFPWLLETYKVQA